MRKRLRFTLDFEVTAEELTDEGLREYYRLRANYEEMVGDEELWANVCRQIPLQRALLEDEEALRRYLTYVVTSEVNLDLDNDLGEVFGVDPDKAEDEILGTLFSRLSSEDAVYFREAIGSNAMFEAVEVLSHSFKITWVSATLDELKEVARALLDGRGK